jgi:hypothetical protein
MIGESDQIYAVDSYLARIQVFSKEGVFLRKFGTKGTDFNELINPIDIILLPSGELLIVDFENGLKVFSKDGKYLRNFSTHEYLLSKPYYPFRIAIDQKNMVYVSIFQDNDYLGINFIACYNQDGSYLGKVLSEESTDGYYPKFYNDIEIDGDNFYLITIGTGYTKTIRRFEIPSNPGESLVFIDMVAQEPETFDPEKTAEIISPTAVSSKNNKIYFLDDAINRLTILSEKLAYIGTIQSPIKSSAYMYEVFKNESIPLGFLGNPQGIKIDKQGRILVANSDYSCISVFDKEGKPINNVGKYWNFKVGEKNILHPGEFLTPLDIAFDSNDNIFVTDPTVSSFQIFDKNFQPKKIITSIKGKNLGSGYLQAMAFDSNQNLLISNSEDASIFILTKQEGNEYDYKMVKEIKLDGLWPAGIDINSNNDIVVALSNTNQIQVIDSEGEIKRKIGELGKDPGQFTGPQGVLVDSADNIYVVETENGRIQKFSPDGSLLWCQNLNWYGLTYIAQDKQGKLYVTDCIHGVVLVLSDSTAIPPSDDDPTPPPESNAEFSFSTNKDQVTEQDAFTLLINVVKLEKTASIDLTIQYPDKLLSVESCDIGNLLTDQSFEAPKIEQSTGFLNITSKSNVNNEASGTGELFKIQMKAKRPGLAYLEFADIKLLNTEGKKVSFASKQGHSIIIQAIDLTPPPLRLQPIPEVVYEPMLLIEGETEAGAKVAINQQELPVNSDGTFEHKLELTKGVNTILVVATDKVGNQTKQTLSTTLKDKIVIELTIGSNVMKVNQKPTQLDVSPYIDKISGRTMVPIRAISGAIGARIDFSQDVRTITITLGAISVELRIGNPLALVNGKEISIDPSGKVTPVIVGGRTFVPLRFVAENFNFKVEWDPKSQKIVLTYPHSVS